MFNKKISLLFITLVFMLSISSVAAFDTNATTDDIEVSEADEEPPSGIAVIPSDIKSVSNDDYSLQTKDLSMYYKNGTRYEVTLTHGDVPVNNASVVISVSGMNYTRHTNDDGIASLAINLIPGNYSISTSFDYDNNSIVLNSDVEVLSTLSGNDVVKTFKNDTQYYATVLDNNGNPLANSEITFNINGVFYNRKTNENGIARLNINLNSGEYILTAIHNNGLMFSNKIVVLPSINGSDVTKFYKNGTQYRAKFYAADGGPLVNTSVNFNINGVYYERTTDENGIAMLNINLLPDSYILTAINPVNGEMASNIVTVLPTLITSDVESESRLTKFDVILINGDSSVGENRYVNITIDGVTYSVETDHYGIASLELNLTNGIHEVASEDVETGLKVYNKINVNGERASNIVTVLPTLITSDVESESRLTKFDVILINGDSSVAEDRYVNITIDGVTYSVETDHYGIASLELNLTNGIHEVASEDVETGLKVYNKINVNAIDAEVDESDSGQVIDYLSDEISYNDEASSVTNETLYYSIYGVSPDNKTIMAIGRPSASGEVSTYGYKFYMTVFERVCPYCGSSELYWGIFWTGDETSNYGVFPATGNKEGGSAEGHIFCANCDADWSVFGNEHVYGGGTKLTVVSQSVLTTKDAAYMLKNGEMIYA